MNKKAEHKAYFVIAVVAIIGLAAVLTGVQNASNQIAGAAVAGGQSPIVCSNNQPLVTPTGIILTDSNVCGIIAGIITPRDCIMSGNSIVPCSIEE